MVTKGTACALGTVIRGVTVYGALGAAGRKYEAKNG